MQRPPYSLSRLSKGSSFVTYRQIKAFGKWYSLGLVFTGVILGLSTASAQTQNKAVASIKSGQYSLSNGLLDIRWKTSENHLSNLVLREKLHNRAIDLSSPFSILLKDGTIY